VLGILGGMGTRASQYFVSKWLSEVERLMSPNCDQDYPDFIVHNAASTPPRNALSLQAARYSLQTSLRALQRLGCDSIIMPCITAHVALGEHRRNYPLFDIFEIVASSLRQHRATNVGVLCTPLARDHGVGELFSPWAPPIMLDSSWDEQILRVIDGLKASVVRQEVLASLDKLDSALRSMGANTVVLGCTEFELALDGHHNTRALVEPLRLAATALARRSSAVHSYAVKHPKVYLSL
jgi:aspartate/glutamate racemase